MLLPRTAPDGMREHFILIADARFSALLVTSPDVQAGGDPFTEHEVIWTFEPDIVFSALEYLMARVTAERFAQTKEFAAAVRRCMPKTTSLHLTVSVTTKLARLLQEQAAREVAVNRIASAIRSTLELPSILQTTVNEVGRALGARACALRIEGDSMIGAGILDGDYVLVRPQQSANNGDIVVALLEESVTVKRFYREADSFRLQPENPRLMPIYVPDVQICGKVVALIRPSVH